MWDRQIAGIARTIFRHVICEIPGQKEVNMDWNQVQGQWKQIKGKAKVKWGKLTDDEIDVIEGRRDQLIGTIQQRYGIKKEEAERQVDDWLREF